MPNKTYSTVQKLAGAALAKLKGADAAAAELKVDKRTVARWLTAAPEDGWTLARDLAQARLQEQLATGKVTAVQLATVAGVADRNVRYGELQRQREARRSVEEADDSSPTHRRARIISKLEQRTPPWDDPAEHRADRYVHDCTYRLMAMWDREDDPEQAERIWSDVPNPGPEHQVGVYFVMRRAADRNTEPSTATKELAAALRPDVDPESMDDAAYEQFYLALLQEVQAAADAWWPGHCAELQANAYAVRKESGATWLWTNRRHHGAPDMTIPPGGSLPPEYEGMPIFADEVPPTAHNVTPPPEPPQRPPEPVQEPRAPLVAVLPAGTHLEDHPSWRRADW